MLPLPLLLMGHSLAWPTRQLRLSCLNCLVLLLLLLQLGQWLALLAHQLGLSSSQHQRPPLQLQLRVPWHAAWHAMHQSLRQ